MNVLSLFDGMSCGRVALEKVGIPVELYFSSEIDKYAITIARKNWPGNIEVGDVTKIQVNELPKIDLLIGGSPCQGFSNAGDGLNFSDPRSALFFEFVRIKNELTAKNPNLYFMLENVCMKKEWQHTISKYMGVEPIKINSALVSAQNRNRLYWTNIPGVVQPEDRGIVLADILQDEVDPKYFLTEIALNRIASRKYSQVKVNPEKTGTLNTKNNSGQLSTDSGTTLITADFVTHNRGRIVTTGDKSLCIDSNYFKGMDNHGQRPLIEFNSYEKKLLIPIPKEIEFIEIENHNSESGFICIGAVEKPGAKRWGNSKTSRQGDFPQGSRVYSDEGKAPTLNAKSGGIGRRTGLYHVASSIRRLTPIECERLQTLPDNYTEGVSDTQRYRMLGNGWTSDVPAHIFSFIP